MRSLTVRSPWSLVRCDLISGAILLAGWMTCHFCLAQEAPAPAQNKKPANPPAKNDGSGKGGPGGMMSQMKGMSGGQEGMMSRMRAAMGGAGMDQMGGRMGMMMGQPGK